MCVANDFIILQENSPIKYVGSKYCDDLHQKSFFQKHCGWLHYVSSVRRPGTMYLQRINVSQYEMECQNPWSLPPSVTYLHKFPAQAPNIELDHPILSCISLLTSAKTRSRGPFCSLGNSEVMFLAHLMDWKTKAKGSVTRLWLLQHREVAWQFWQVKQLPVFWSH